VKHISCHIQCENSVTFFNFRISEDSVARWWWWWRHCRRGGNICSVYIENFPTNHLVKEFWRSVHICQSYYQISRSIF